MSNSLPVNLSWCTKNTSLSTHHQVETKKIKKDQVESTQDSLVQTLKSKCVKLTSVPALIQPQASKAPKNDLAILAAAFMKAAEAMDRGIIMQILDYVGLQKLDQTQAKIVLKSTINAINKQQKAEKLAAEEKAYAQQEAAAQGAFSTVMGIFGALLILGTIISVVFTGGATAAALPEEVSFEMADLSGVAVEEVVDNVEVAAEGVVEGVDVTADASESGANAAQMIEETEATPNFTSKIVKWAAKKGAKWFAKKGLHMVVALGFASPMLWKGISSTNIGEKLEKLVAAEAAAGAAVGKLQQNNMYFQFLQKLVQRSGGVIEQEVSSVSDVIETFSSITNAYKNISYGLANAV